MIRSPLMLLAFVAGCGPSATGVDGQVSGGDEVTLVPSEGGEALDDDDSGEGVSGEGASEAEPSDESVSANDVDANDVDATTLDGSTEEDSGESAESEESGTEGESEALDESGDPLPPETETGDGDGSSESSFSPCQSEIDDCPEGELCIIYDVGSELGYCQGLEGHVCASGVGGRVDRECRDDEYCLMSALADGSVPCIPRERAIEICELLGGWRPLNCASLLFDPGRPVIPRPHGY